MSNFLTPIGINSLTGDQVPFGDRDQALAAVQHVTGFINGKPTIQIGPQHAELADAAWLALMYGNDERYPKILARGSTLVRHKDGFLEPLTKHALRDRLSRVANFVKLSGGQNPMPIAVEAPLPIAETILNRTLYDFWNVPRVERVVEVPVLGTDGELIVTPGYHANDRVYYHPAAGLEDVEKYILDWELVEHVAQAKSLLLDDLLGDFKFEGDASRANALGLLLLPFVRDVIGDYPTPMHAIMAHDPETGKGTLAQACMIPGCGLLSASPFEGGAEMRKHITSLLYEGTAAVLFDNLHDTISDPNLAAALTTGKWVDRRLGYTEMLKLNVRTIWVATANNPTMTREHARRATGIYIQKHPKGYQYKHHNLTEWALQHRAELVGAALTLVRFWAEGAVSDFGDGQFRFHVDDRHYSNANLGSFEKWASVVGGILEQTDVSGFLQNRHLISASVDVETQEDTKFVQAWHDALGSDPTTSTELARKLAWPPFNDVLPTELAGCRPEQIEKTLRYWLRSRRGRNYSGYMIMAQEQNRGPNLWAILTAEDKI